MLRGSGGGSARETLQPVSPSDTATPAKPPSGYGVTLVMAIQGDEYLKPLLGAVKNSYGQRWFHRPRYVMMAGVTRKPAAVGSAAASGPCCGDLGQSGCLYPEALPTASLSAQDNPLRARLVLPVAAASSAVA